MRSSREIAMLRASTLAVLVTAAVLTGGCDMNTTNPNAPDTKRAFGTPEGLTQLLAGAIQTWVRLCLALRLDEQRDRARSGRRSYRRGAMVRLLLGAQCRDTRRLAESQGRTLL